MNCKKRVSEKKVMKKFCFLVILGLMSLIFISSGVDAARAQDCKVKITLINQNPYPVMPGEYVDILFQVKGLETKGCGDFYFEIIENYPFSLDPGKERGIEVKSGTFTRDYEDYLMIPYTLRVAKDALEGDNKIEIRYKTGSSNVFVIEKFNINVEEVQTDFEIFIRDYDASRRLITFEVLNSGKNNAEALRLEIPKQDNITIKGSPVSIIGALDLHDFATTNFEAFPLEGEIKINVYYKDILDETRMLEKSVYFEPEYFEGRLRDEEPESYWVYYIIAGVGVILLYIIYSKYQKSKKRKLFD